MSCHQSAEQAQLAYQQYFQAMQQMMAAMPAANIPPTANAEPNSMGIHSAQMPPMMGYPHFYGQPMMGYPHLPFYGHHMMPAMGMGLMSQTMPQTMPSSMSQPMTETAAQATNEETANPLMDGLFEQAQGMLDDVLGENATLFNDVLGSLGMNDKEFWKGAMVGAAAALLLSNDTVRQKLWSGLAGAGDLLKNAGGQAKDFGLETAANVQQAAAKNSDIFKQTYAAGKEGYQTAVAKHQAPDFEEQLAETDPQQATGENPPSAPVM